MTDEVQAKRARATRVGLGAGALAALAMAVATLPADEGKRNIGYLDIAKVPTACFGHTGPEVRVGEDYTDGECRLLLEQDAVAHLRGVLGCTPGLAGRPDQLAAATRLAFNIGVANYCGSTAARLFRAHDWRGGCDAFLRWDHAGGRFVKGLADRRAREREACLNGLPE